MRIFKKLLKIFDNLPMILAGIALFTIIALEGMQAISRYVFRYSFLFVDDLAVICFGWAIFAGSAAAFQQKMHFGLDVLVNSLKGKTKDIFMIVTQILTAVVLAYFLYYSVVLYQNVGPKVLTSTGISYRWLDASLVYGFAMMLIFNIRFLVTDIRALKSGEKEEIPE